MTVHTTTNKVPVKPSPARQVAISSERNRAQNVCVVKCTQAMCTVRVNDNLRRLSLFMYTGTAPHFHFRSKNTRAYIAHESTQKNKKPFMEQRGGSRRQHFAATTRHGWFDVLSSMLLLLSITN